MQTTARGATMNATQGSIAAMQLADVLRHAIPNLMAAYVHGSTARGDDRADSDIDIALLLPPEQRLTDPLALAAKLHEATGRQADITDLRRAGNVLRMQVLREGKQFINACPDQVLAWEAYAMNEYAQHRVAIHGILQDFQNTGIGYTNE